MNATNKIVPGAFLSFQRKGETVVIKFEYAEIAVSRTGAIALAYFLSELVDPPFEVE